MEAMIKKEIVINLALNEEEAIWLKGMVQNPLSNDPDLVNEDPKNAKMRKRFWDALEPVTSI